MSTLKDRIAALGSISPKLNMIGPKDYYDVKAVPRSRIRIHHTGNYLSYEELEPLVTATGATVAAAGPGTWGELYAAGNRRGRY